MWEYSAGLGPEDIQRQHTSTLRDLHVNPRISSHSWDGRLARAQGRDRFLGTMGWGTGSFVYLRVAMSTDTISEYKIFKSVSGANWEEF